jgi:hypothetical protein
MDIVGIAIFANPLCGLIIGIGILTDKGSDMLSGGGTIQTTDSEPTIGINHSHTGDIGKQVSSAVALNLNVSLGIGHSGQFLDSVHSDYLSFNYVFRSPWNNYIIAHPPHFVKYFFQKKPKKPDISVRLFGKEDYQK